MSPRAQFHLRAKGLNWIPGSACGGPGMTMYFDLAVPRRTLHARAAIV